MRSGGGVVSVTAAAAVLPPASGAATPTAVVDRHAPEETPTGQAAVVLVPVCDGSRVMIGAVGGGAAAVPASEAPAAESPTAPAVAVTAALLDDDADEGAYFCLRTEGWRKP